MKKKAIVYTQQVHIGRSEIAFVLQDYTYVGSPNMPPGQTNLTTVASGAYAGNYYTGCSSRATDLNSASWCHVLPFNTLANNNSITSNSTQYWASSRTAYNTSSGAYAGAFSTTVNSVAYTGEFLHLQVPTAFVLKRYVYVGAAGQYGSANGWPAEFKIIGSNDGSTWSAIDTQTGRSGNGTGTDITIDTLSNTTAYSYYRFVCHAISPGGSVGYWAMSKFWLYRYV